VNKQTPLQKKLASYAAFSASILGAGLSSHAQILYTNVLPDDTLIPHDYLPLDLNNDGIADFYVGEGRHVFHYWTGALLFNSTNEVENSMAGVATYSYYGSVANYMKFAHMLEANSPIDGGNNWVKPNEFKFTADQGVNPYEAAIFNLRIDYYDYFGYWNEGNKDGFVGLRIKLNGDYLYGWARLEVYEDATHVVVKDFAVNLAPNQPILAGEGMSGICMDGYEPNNFSSQASLIPVNTKVKALIDMPGDKDWFQFTPPADQNNILIVLKKMPANYNIKLYDQNLQVLDVSKHPGKLNDTIIYNDLDPSQHYYVVVKGQNLNAFNETDCYTLKVEASSTPYKLMDSPAPEQEIAGLEIFPNPSSHKIFVSGMNEDFSSAEASVYDLSGRKAFSQTISSQQTVLDISALTEGMYLLQLKNETQVVVKKFEVKR
jgi:Secretion system C-terminal sorting domain